MNLDWKGSARAYFLEAESNSILKRDIIEAIAPAMDRIRKTLHNSCRNRTHFELHGLKIRFLRSTWTDPIPKGGFAMRFKGRAIFEAKLHRPELWRGLSTLPDRSS